MGPPAHGFNKNSPPPRIGARFSRESVKTLNNRSSSHSRHPYPNKEEMEMLQRQSGLNKPQISNWLANARRRGKIQPARSTSPHVGSTWTGPINIPPSLHTFI
ncbi:homeobox protein 4 [Colletotrichum liriopes]|uniref:Homeobox protein 4 n=1 Tax=Colletotrichum liriopes TaxID=708192 RepID=A0AA37GAI0_9PEZI|nr:homeobox protein 4 [Colletotrichum liriopes]